MRADFARAYLERLDREMKLIEGLLDAYATSHDPDVGARLYESARRHRNALTFMNRCRTAGKHREGLNAAQMLSDGWARTLDEIEVRWGTPGYVSATVTGRRRQEIRERLSDVWTECLGPEETAIDRLNAGAL